MIDRINPVTKAVYIHWLRSVQDAPGREQDFEVVGNLTKLRAKLEADIREFHCHQFLVLNEAGQYTVWRKDD